MIANSIISGEEKDFRILRWLNGKIELKLSGIVIFAFSAQSIINALRIAGLEPNPSISSLLSKT